MLCKELWIQRPKTVSKIYHFVSLHQQSIGIVFCWADELVEGLFCDGLLYKAASKIIFSLIFIQQQRFDFNHLLQKTCSDRCMIWNIAGNSVEMIKVIFCCHLTWPANVKIWLFSAKTALWNMIWSIAEKSSHHFVWALLEAWERFYLGLNMANTICLKHPKATTILLNFGISSLIIRRKKEFTSVTFLVIL